MRSKLLPFKYFAKFMRKHEDLIINWFKAKKAYSSGSIEGLIEKLIWLREKVTVLRALKFLNLLYFKR